MDNNKTAIAWAEVYLANNQYILQGSFETVRIMPWSSVYRVLTSRGYIYLKLMAPPFVIEAKLLNYLAGQFSVCLPTVITIKEELACFLMVDAGMPLRYFLKDNYQIDLSFEALNSYAILQHATINQVDDLLSLGVPDWRLEKLPNLYQELISKQKFLALDGLNHSEINKLEQLQLKFSNLCDKLLGYKIPETIEHCDFHDNNILMKEDKFIFNDWGDAVISHPFFSLVSWLKSAERNHNITKGSEIYNKLRNTYLNNWLTYGTIDRLLEVYELAEKIGTIKFAASFYRITTCAGMDSLNQYKSTIAQALRSFIQLVDN